MTEQFLIGRDGAERLDETLRQCSDWTIKRIQRDLKSENDAPGEQASALLIGVMSAAAIGLFQSRLRKALLGDIVSAMTRKHDDDD